VCILFTAGFRINKFLIPPTQCISLFVYGHHGTTRISSSVEHLMPLPVAARSKMLVCGRSSAATATSNPTGGTEVSILRVMRIVRQRSLRRTDYSSRGALPTVVCRCVLSINLMNEEALVIVGSQRQKMGF
jgi:hypothetical protein